MKDLNSDDNLSLTIPNKTRKISTGWAWLVAYGVLELFAPMWPCPPIWVRVVSGTRLGICHRLNLFSIKWGGKGGKRGFKNCLLIFLYTITHQASCLRSFMKKEVWNTYIITFSNWSLKPLRSPVTHIGRVSLAWNWNKNRLYVSFKSRICKWVDCIKFQLHYVVPSIKIQ